MTPPVNGGDTAYGLATYVAAIGCNGPFPDTNNYWGTGQSAPNGITNGPLTAFSGTSAGMPAPWPVNGAQSQGCFSVVRQRPVRILPRIVIRYGQLLGRRPGRRLLQRPVRHVAAAVPELFYPDQH